MDLTLGHTARIRAAAKKHALTIPQEAYVLATAYWETARTMQPVEEAYYLGSKAAAYRRKLRYYPWYGRGFVQLTWEANYRKAGQKIGVDLIANPALALDPDHAAEILVLGSKEGWFTGKGLSRYIGEKVDYVNARRIINGTDKAKEIAAIAGEYEATIRAEPVEPLRNSAPLKPHPLATIIAAVLRLFRR